MSHDRNQEMENCIDNCRSCHEVCLETISHCLEMGGEHANPDHVKLLQDCVQICQTNADFMIRGSSRHMLTCGVCAAICEACADECEKMATGDGADIMQRCADACRRCAESCRQMSGSMQAKA